MTNKFHHQNIRNLKLTSDHIKIFGDGFLTLMQHLILVITNDQLKKRLELYFLVRTDG